MASIFIGLNRGQSEMPSTSRGTGASTGGIAENSSTNSTDVELRIDTGKGLTRNDVTNLTEALLRYLQDGRTAVFPL